MSKLVIITQYGPWRVVVMVLGLLGPIIDDGCVGFLKDPHLTKTEIKVNYELIYLKIEP